MRIAIGVHGRFHAFDVARAVADRGHEVHLYTNYPRRVVARFGFSPQQTRSFIAHGLASRIAGDRLEGPLKRGFGTWLAHKIGRSRYDAAFCWSGIAEETFAKTRAMRLLNRSSMHIAAQYALLAEEERRTAHAMQKPSPWIIERERREYRIADRIIVPSESARMSFEGHGDEHKVRVVPLAADSRRWAVSEATAAARASRIRRGDRLRVLFVGAVSYRKGMHDLATIVERMHDRIRFRITGVVTAECADLVARLQGKAHFDGHVPVDRLAGIYAESDVLILPSIEDGFGLVLSHAQAAALPFIASSNTGGPDLLKLGGRGWIVPIRAPEQLEQQIDWCDEQREAVAQSVLDLYCQPITRSWLEVADDLIRIAGEAAA